MDGGTEILGGEKGGDGLQLATNIQHAVLSAREKGRLERKTRPFRAAPRSGQGLAGF